MSGIRKWRWWIVCGSLLRHDGCALDVLLQFVGAIFLTITRLQESFIKNEELRSRHKLRVKNAVDLSLAKRPGISIHQLQDQLKADKIQLILNWRLQFYPWR